MYTFSPMMVANSRKHHCRVRTYTREVLVLSTNLEIQTKHYPLVFRNRRGDEARIKKTIHVDCDIEDRHHGPSECNAQPIPAITDIRVILLYANEDGNPALVSINTSYCALKDVCRLQNEWDLGALAYSQDTEGPYHTDFPTREEIHQFLQFQRVDSNRKIKNKNVILSANQVLTKELRQDLKRWNELIYENVFGLGGHRDHLLAFLAHILYCILAEQQYNLAYFFVKRIESARATPKSHRPYVMRPLALRQVRRPRSDHGKARHSVSSTSTHHNRRSSSRREDDDEDDGASRASTPSHTTYLNSLKPLNYQQYEIPSPSEQSDDLLFERQTKVLNQSQEIHKEVRGGFKSLGKALRGVFGKKKK
ncbi:hypothetical protein Tco_0090630 [Tanacetum coccineum]